MATHSSTLAWEIPWTEDPGRLVYGFAKSQTQLSDFSFGFSVSCSLQGPNSLNRDRTHAPCSECADF